MSASPIFIADEPARSLQVILIREFQSPDEEMKKIVLKVVKQCSATDGVQPQYVKVEILPQFFANFWVRRSEYFAPFPKTQSCYTETGCYAAQSGVGPT